MVFKPKLAATNSRQDQSISSLASNVHVGVSRSTRSSSSTLRSLANLLTNKQRSTSNPKPTPALSTTVQDAHQANTRGTSLHQSSPSARATKLPFSFRMHISVQMNERKADPHPIHRCSAGAWCWISASRSVNPPSHLISTIRFFTHAPFSERTGSCVAFNIYSEERRMC